MNFSYVSLPIPLAPSAIPTATPAAASILPTNPLPSSLSLSPPRCSPAIPAVSNAASDTTSTAAVTSACSTIRRLHHQRRQQQHERQHGITSSSTPLSAYTRTPAPKDSDYFFWSGVSARRTCINIWEDTYKKMFQRAGIAGHSHQLRHTFAVNLLQKGVSMGNVSTLLGHRSIKITEKYYANWVAARQQHLDAEVRRTW